MNHCGRPECECYKRCCARCATTETNGIERFEVCEYPKCPCHENPVQKGQRCLHCEKPVRVGSIEEVCMCPERQADGSWKPIQEWHRGTIVDDNLCDNPFCWCQPSFDMSPDAEEWEKGLEKSINNSVSLTKKLGMGSVISVDVLFAEMKSFFRSQIEQAEKSGIEIGLDKKFQDDRIQKSLDSQRSRILDAIGKLMEKDFGDFVNYHDRVTWTAACDAILKVIHEV